MDFSSRASIISATKKMNSRRKRMMSFKRLLAVFVALCLFASFLPAAIASDIGEVTENDEAAAGIEAEAELTDELTEDEPAEDEPAEDELAEEEPSEEEPDIIPPEVMELEIQDNQNEPVITDETAAEEEQTLSAEVPEEERQIIAVCRGEGYESLQKAIDAAGEQDADIYLEKPVGEDVEIGKNQNITISLNGNGFLGEMVNYGNLTILGEGFFDGVLISRAHHVKENDETVDFASGRTLVKDGMFSGVLAVEQESDAPLEGDDPLPQLIIENGTFVNVDGEELVCRFVRWDENGNAEYSENDTAGEILLTGGSFAHFPAYAAPGYRAVDYGGMYGIEAFRGEETQEGSEEEPVLHPSEDKQEEQPEEDEKPEEEELLQEEYPNARKAALNAMPPLTLEMEKEPAFTGEAKTGDEEEYDISYDVPVPADAPKKYKSSEGVDILPEPSDTTIPFAGWYLDSNFTDGPHTKIAAGSTGDRTYFARWQYDVQVYVNGNAYGKAVYGETVINSSNTVQVLSGNDFILNLEPTSNDCRVSKVLVKSIDAEFEPDKLTVKRDVVSHNMKVEVFFDVWPTHTVTFVYNDDATPTKTLSVKDKTNAPFETPVRNGYKFLGWLCNLNGTIYQVSDEYPVEHSVSFEAQWELETYKLIYVMNNNAVAPYEPETFTMEDEFDLKKPEAQAVFLGWYLDSTLTDSPVTKIEKGTTENVTVYGKWQPCTVVFNRNDGSASTSQTVIPGNPVTLPAAQRSGYQFLGWRSSEDGNMYREGTYIPKGDVTFTAQWEKIPTYYRVYVYYNTFGTVSCNGAIITNRSYFDVEEGESVTLYFNPLSTSYYPYNCTVNNVKKGSISSLTLENIRDNQVVSVTFAPTFARPMTGDSGNLLLWAGLMALSGAAAGILIKRKKKKQ